MSGDSQYLQLLREQMALFDQLAKVRTERNDIRELKMDTWDKHRPRFETNAAFHEMWRSTEHFRRVEVLNDHEEEILVALDRMKAKLDHLRYAGLAA